MEKNKGSLLVSYFAFLHFGLVNTQVIVIQEHIQLYGYIDWFLQKWNFVKKSALLNSFQIPILRTYHQCM